MLESAARTRAFTSGLDIVRPAEFVSAAARTAREGYGAVFPAVPLTILALDYSYCLPTDLVDFTWQLT